MLTLGGFALTAPWMLLGLAGLPVLWWLLRLLPPAPRRIDFPAIRFLFGLRGEETTPQAAPWWLVLLRLAIAALVVIAAARPVLNPDPILQGAGPVILVIDDGWASAPDWDRRLARAKAVLDGAARADRPVYLVLGAPPADGGAFEPVHLTSAAAAQEILGGLAPKAWPIDRKAQLPALESLAAQGVSGDVVWLSNGLESDGSAAMAALLSKLGDVTVLTPDLSNGPLVLSPPGQAGSQLSISVARAEASQPLSVPVIAYSADNRPLFRGEARFGAGQTQTEVTLDMPIDLRNAVAQVSLLGQAGIGATTVLDERWSRRPVGILTDVGNREVLPLLSEVYFLDRAVSPLGEVSRGDLATLLKVPQAILILPDETALDTADVERLSDWIDQGGMVVRFAGPRLAAHVDDPLVPVKLRSGGRQLSGAMLWTEPAHIGGVSKDGPFDGIRLPKDVEINQQVLAEPSLDLDGKTWMRLTDDTPLVTADRRGKGWLVLIHTSANTQWSNLALSGLFVDMLERLSHMVGGIHQAGGESGFAPPYRLLDGFGRIGDPQASARPLDLAALDDAKISAANPPGFYGSQAVRVAFNAGPKLRGDLRPLTSYPAGALVSGYEQESEQPVTGYFVLAALILLLIDTILTAVLRGFTGVRPSVRSGGAAAAVLVLAAIFLTGMPSGRADEARTIPPGAQQTTLAYVLTGDPEVDRVSQAGLIGLSEVLRQRTAVEAGDPIGIDLDRDDLVFYPLLYWPISQDQPALSAPAVDRLNRYMAGGGVILFDTRDGDLAQTRFFSGSEVLQRLARDLHIPAVAPVPPDHVLTRAFYLMQDFPGRWRGGTVWVESGPSTSNDGVSPVVVGDADWAGAWAVDAADRPLFPINGADERQREMAYRFGVNLVMYTLTGNYKSDQVHIPAILERLGQ